MIPIRDTVPSRGTPVVTWGLIAVNVAVFFYELTLAPEELERLFYLFGVVPARFSDPQWARWVGFPVDDYWPFVTSMFLHGGWMHVIGNMWTLLTGLAAGLTHWFTNADSTVPTVGASGAIAGVLGAYFVLFPFSRIITLFPVLFLPFFFELPAATYLLFWFLSQVWSGTLAGLGPDSVGGVAWWAHVGGFVAGVALHRLFVLPRRSRPRPWERDEAGVEGAWVRWR